MKLYRWLALAALIAGCVWMTGCKKEESTELDYMTGKLTLSMPEFVNPGYTKTFMIDTLMKVRRPDGGPVGYRILNSETGATDTLVTADGVIKEHYYTLTVSDDLSTQSLTLTAFVGPDVKYYTSSVSASYTVVNPGFGPDASLTNVDFDEADLFIDDRDLNIYFYAEVQGRDWMLHNLAWDVLGAPYKRCDAMTEVFGNYYTWEEAQVACPDGWRLPTDAEWTELLIGAVPGKDLEGLAGLVMGDVYFNGKKMWEYWRDVTITNLYGLWMIPTGYATIADDEYTFDGLYKYAAFWTADESDGLGICRYIYHDKDVVYRGKMSKTDFAASVRCVRETGFFDD